MALRSRSKQRPREWPRRRSSTDTTPSSSATGAISASNSNLYTTTGTETHKRVAQQFFLTLLDKGYLYRHTVEQFYDEQAGGSSRSVHRRNLSALWILARTGRSVRQLRPYARPHRPDLPTVEALRRHAVLRQTEHYYWKLSEFSKPLLDWLKTRQGWRPHVLNMAVGMVEEGLHDRSFTRDLDWGIPLPVDDLGPGKSIYVWWEAVMGYFSASQEWAEIQGDPDAWKKWWENSEAKSYYFMGKDNVPFHAIYWPALLMGHGGLNLPTDVPANQFLTIGGEKASKSMGVGRPLNWYLQHVEPTRCDTPSRRTSQRATTRICTRRRSSEASTASSWPIGGTLSTAWCL